MILQSLEFQARSVQEGIGEPRVPKVSPVYGGLSGKGRTLIFVINFRRFFRLWPLPLRKRPLKGSGMGSVYCAMGDYKGPHVLKMTP